MLRMRHAARATPTAPFHRARMPSHRRGVQELFEAGAKASEWNQAGRAWRASELRLKSFDDLHKLWYVLLKEKNLLLSQREMMDDQGQKSFKRKNSKLWKVKKSMARLLTVLSERKNLYNEYKASLKLASKLPDSQLPSVESLKGKPEAKPAAGKEEKADAASTAATDAKAAPTTPRKVAADGRSPNYKVPTKPRSSAEKEAERAARKAAKASAPPVKIVVSMSPEERAAMKRKRRIERKGERVQRNWKEIRAKWKADKLAAAMPTTAPPAEGASSTTESTTTT